ncbi:putative membrane protein, partial [Chlamydia psittaci 84-8471/1]
YFVPWCWVSLLLVI